METVKILTSKRMSRKRDCVDGAGYTDEICRCLDFMFGQIMKGRSVETAFHQASSFYGFSIAENARMAIRRNLNKTI